MADPKDIARQWLEMVLIGGSLPDITAVVYLDHPTSDAPRPPDLPYAGMMIDDDRPQGYQTPINWTEDTAGWPAALPPGEKYPQHSEWAREGQLIVGLYGPDSLARARLLQLSLSRADVVEFLATEQVAIRQGVTIDNASDILDTTREERASLTFSVSWVDRMTYDVDAIESVDPALTVEK